tara:strand:- start:901 stop:1245 length:345 start_codon:yes stop_codon:yes gene_type:complete
MKLETYLGDFSQLIMDIENEIVKPCEDMSCDGDCKGGIHFGERSVHYDDGGPVTEGTSHGSGSAQVRIEFESIKDAFHEWNQCVQMDGYYISFPEVIIKHDHIMLTVEWEGEEP